MVRQRYHCGFYSRIRNFGHDYECWQQVEDDVQSINCISEEIKESVTLCAHPKSNIQSHNIEESDDYLEYEDDLYICINGLEFYIPEKLLEHYGAHHD